MLRACVRFRQALEEALGRLDDREWQLLGPAPAAVAKVNNRYRYRLTLTAPNSRAREAAAGCTCSGRPIRTRTNRGVSLYADVNPY